MNILSGLDEPQTDLVRLELAVVEQHLEGKRHLQETDVMCE